MIEEKQLFEDCIENSKKKILSPGQLEYLKNVKQDFYEFDFGKRKLDYDSVKRITMHYFKLISMSHKRNRFLSELNFT